LAKLVSGLLLGCCLIAGGAAQQPLATLQADADYRLIAPQPVTTGDRIEVIEFFWYGCPYCYELQPPLDAWLRRKPPDVAFRRIPAVFRPTWVPHARIYYTLEALGAAERLHRAVYDGHHIDRLATDDAEAMADWAARHGLDRPKRKRWSSPKRSRRDIRCGERRRSLSTVATSLRAG
jgi:thiol:disulfide interchange protein DsbA